MVFFFFVVVVLLRICGLCLVTEKMWEMLNNSAQLE